MCNSKYINFLTHSHKPFEKPFVVGEFIFILFLIYFFGQFTIIEEHKKKENYR